MPPTPSLAGNGPTLSVRRPAHADEPQLPPEFAPADHPVVREELPNGQSGWARSIDSTTLPYATDRHPKDARHPCAAWQTLQCKAMDQRKLINLHHTPAPQQWARRWHQADKEARLRATGKVMAREHQPQTPAHGQQVGGEHAAHGEQAADMLPAHVLGSISRMHSNPNRQRDLHPQPWPTCSRRRLPEQARVPQANTVALRAASSTQFGSPREQPYDRCGRIQQEHMCADLRAI